MNAETRMLTLYYAALGVQVVLVFVASIFSTLALKGARTTDERDSCITALGTSLAVGVICYAAMRLPSPVAIEIFSYALLARAAQCAILILVVRVIFRRRARWSVTERERARRQGYMREWES